MSKISIIHATLGRPQKAIDCRDMWFKRAVHPENIEYVFGTHAHDDKAAALRRISGMEQKQHYQTIFTETARKGSAANYYKAGAWATGALLIQSQDDLEPPERWDELLLERLQKTFGGEWENRSAFIAVSDGYRKDGLCITTIMTRPYLVYKGEFGSAEYPGLYFDDENTYRAYRDQRDGKCTVIEARDLIFRHRHHSNDTAVPFDETYALENCSNAYHEGQRVFVERNPEAGRDGLKKW